MSDAATAHASVLVIDDDDVRSLLAATLEVEGFDVSTARDGEEGLRARDSRPVDCVVLDLMMSGLDGHAVPQRIRNGGDMTLPVIMLTAAGDDAQAWQAWAGGVDCFMAKPFDMGCLLQQVGQLCAFRTQTSARGTDQVTTLPSPSAV